MKYYAHINSKDELAGIDKVKLVKDEYGSDKVQNIEVAEDIYIEPDRYVYIEGEIVPDPHYVYKVLARNKSEKIVVNDKLRDKALLGGVEYQGVLFDSDTDQKINLLATVSNMSDTDTVTWYGMDNKALLCTKNDLIAIGTLITELHSFCWNNNAYIKEQIEEAKTVEELEQIEIDYGGYND